MSSHASYAVALAASCMLAAPLLAQNRTVVPASAATTEGNSLDIRPFGLERVRATQLIPMDVLGIPSGRQITELAYRRDGQILRTQTMSRRRTASWSIRMGNIDTRVAAGRAYNPVNPTGLYMRPGNGTNSLIEYYNAVPSWPTLPPSVGSTAPFSIRFKLRSPFTVAGPSGIAVDFYVYGSNGRQVSYYIDAVRSDVDRGSSSSFGTSCPVNNVNNRSDAVPSNPGGDPLEYSLFGAVPFTPAILAIGASKTRWAGFTLPLPLGGLGLTGCNLLVSHDILLPATVLSTGSTRLRFALPAQASLAGVTTFAQWMVVDGQINPAFPLTFSDGVEVTTGTTVGTSGLRTSLLYGVNQASVVRGRYGLVDRGYSFVTEFTHN